MRSIRNSDRGVVVRRRPELAHTVLTTERRNGCERHRTTHGTRIRAWREQPWDPVPERAWGFESPLAHPSSTAVLLEAGSSGAVDPPLSYAMTNTWQTNRGLTRVDQERERREQPRLTHDDGERSDVDRVPDPPVRAAGDQSPRRIPRGRGCSVRPPHRARRTIRTRPRPLRWAPPPARRSRSRALAAGSAMGSGPPVPGTTNVEHDVANGEPHRRLAETLQRVDHHSGRRGRSGVRPSAPDLLPSGSPRTIRWCGGRFRSSTPEQDSPIDHAR
jgi:hypothetical protein